jgi:hypothetical protein
MYSIILGGALDMVVFGARFESHIANKQLYS